MGDPKRSRKKYEKPRKPWEAKRIQEEREIVEKYGLKNKRELWRALTTVKKYRREARKILAEIATGKATEHTKRKEKEMLSALIRRGILRKSLEEASLDDVLSLTVEDLLERRLQTLVFKKGLANSPKHARQLIVHGHISVAGRKVTVPSYIVSVDEEQKIGYYGKMALVEATAAESASATTAERAAEEGEHAVGD